MFIIYKHCNTSIRFNIAVIINKFELFDATRHMSRSITFIAKNGALSGTSSNGGCKWIRASFEKRITPDNYTFNQRLTLSRDVHDERKNLRKYLPATQGIGEAILLPLPCGYRSTVDITYWPCDLKLDTSGTCDRIVMTNRACPISVAKTCNYKIVP